MLCSTAGPQILTLELQLDPQNNTLTVNASIDCLLHFIPQRFQTLYTPAEDTQGMTQTCQWGRGGGGGRSVPAQPCTGWLSGHLTKYHCPFTIFSVSKEKNYLFYSKGNIKICKYLPLQSIFSASSRLWLHHTSIILHILFLIFFLFFAPLPCSIPPFYSHTIYCCPQITFVV